MNNDNKEFCADAIFLVLDELTKARRKHPDFAISHFHAISLIAEELGELAQEINGEYECCPGWRERAIMEAAHVAVTAIRTIELLKEGTL